MVRELRELVLVVVLAIALLFAISRLSGCQTVKGACGDSAWILQTTADNIQPEK